MKTDKASKTVATVQHVFNDKLLSEDFRRSTQSSSLHADLGVLMDQIKKYDLGMGIDPSSMSDCLHNAVKNSTEMTRAIANSADSTNEYDQGRQLTSLFVRLVKGLESKATISKKVSGKKRKEGHFRNKQECNRDAFTMLQNVYNAINQELSSTAGRQVSAVSNEWFTNDITMLTFNTLMHQAKKIGNEVFIEAMDDANGACILLIFDVNTGPKVKEYVLKYIDKVINPEFIKSVKQSKLLKGISDEDIKYGMFMLAIIKNACFSMMHNLEQSDKYTALLSIATQEEERILARTISTEDQSKDLNVASILVNQLKEEGHLNRSMLVDSGHGYNYVIPGRPESAIKRVIDNVNRINSHKQRLIANDSRMVDYTNQIRQLLPIWQQQAPVPHSYQQHPSYHMQPPHYIQPPAQPHHYTQQLEQQKENDIMYNSGQLVPVQPAQKYIPIMPYNQQIQDQHYPVTHSEAHIFQNPFNRHAPHQSLYQPPYVTPFIEAF